MVEAGLGIAILPHGVVMPYRADGHLAAIELAEPWAQRWLNLAVREYRALPIVARELVRHLLGGDDVASIRPPPTAGALSLTRRSRESSRLPPAHRRPPCAPFGSHLAQSDRVQPHTAVVPLPRQALDQVDGDHPPPLLEQHRLGHASRCKRRRLILPLATRHDLEGTIRQRPLERTGLAPGCGEPGLDLLRRGQDHRHRLRVDRTHLAVRCCREKPKEVGGRGVARSPKVRHGVGMVSIDDRRQSGSVGLVADVPFGGPARRASAPAGQAAARAGPPRRPSRRASPRAGRSGRQAPSARERRGCCPIWPH